MPGGHPASGSYTMHIKDFEKELKRRCNAEMFVARSASMSKRTGVHPECLHVFDRSHKTGGIYWQHAICTPGRMPREPQEIDIIRIQKGAFDASVRGATGDWANGQMAREGSKVDSVEEQIRSGMAERVRNLGDKIEHMRRMRRVARVAPRSALGKKEFFLPMGISQVRMRGKP